MSMQRFTVFPIGKCLIQFNERINSKALPKMEELFNLLNTELVLALLWHNIYREIECTCTVFQMTSKTNPDKITGHYLSVSFKWEGELVDQSRNKDIRVEVSKRVRVFISEVAATSNIHALMEYYSYNPPKI